MKSNENSLPATDFFQLTISSLLELCTHRIDGHCIVSIEGRLLLTLDTGDKVALDILQHDVDNVSKPIIDDDANKSSSTLMAPVRFCAHLVASVYKLYYQLISFYCIMICCH